MIPMIEKNIKKEFIEFLKQNNALKEYKENLIRYKKRFFPEDIISIIIDPLRTITSHTDTYYNIIDYSFRWKHTPQGHDYWAKLNSQWNKTLWNKILAQKNKSIKTLL